ncbi:uncharacterized protein LOC108607684 [Drosophila busckii]|uniref:uncharacterized protein LOC108607684 n=1 Tax=Drosophila busckii TaxID=30019 RepID=UPI00083F2CB7|nr:uncharacterized protein LOC108607684 [Drosophila busckii]
MASTTTYTCKQYIDLASAASLEPGHMSTSYELDAARFSQHDLGLFMESLETIARIERERHERQQQRRERKLQQQRMAELQDERCVSPTPSVEDAVDEPLMYLEAKCIPYAVSESLPIKQQSSNSSSPTYDTCDDEAYGSSAHSPRSSVTYCSCTGLESESDSAESGIYGGSSMRPRSEVLSKPKQRSTRSRIINMVLKREYGRAPATPPPATSTLKHPYHYQYEHLTSKSRRGIAIDADSPEERFFDKALRYLTL